MRTVFMAYLTGSIEAVEFYCRAFDATQKNCFKASDDDDYYAHAEIVIDDQTVMALSEASHYGFSFAERNNMQFWMTFDDEQSLVKACSVLSEKADIHSPLAPSEWCKLLADVTDKFGIRWMLNLF